jgi:hypothetical protein
MAIFPLEWVIYENYVNRHLHPEIPPEFQAMVSQV